MQSTLDLSPNYRRSNPFRHSRRSWRVRLFMYASVLIVCLLSTIVLLLYHPFFRVSEDHIQISGAKRASVQEIQATIAGAIAGRVWGIIPRDSVYFMNTREIDDILTQKFALQSSRTRSIFPHALSVTIAEKQSTILLHTGSQYARIGADGRVIELLRPFVATSATATSSPPLRDIRANYGNDPLVIGTTPIRFSATSTAIASTTIFGLFEWFDHAAQGDITISYVRLGPSENDAVLQTGQGFEALVRLTERVPEQLMLIRTILERQKKPHDLSYIDTRYHGRVYWR